MLSLTYQFLDFSIRKVALVNYRKFGSLEVMLHPHITALTAPNGGGKSAVLQALAIACAHYVYGLGITPGIPNGFSPDDHRMLQQEGMGMVPANGDIEVHCVGCVPGSDETQWSRERSYKVNAKTRYGNAAVLQQAATYLLERSAGIDAKVSTVYPIAPLLGFYDTRRLARESRLTENRKPTQGNRFEGYADCLALGSYIRVFKSWYRNISAQLLQEALGSAAHTLLSTQRDIVNEAVATALRHVGWQNLKWDFMKNDLSMEHPVMGTLCFSQLSDGIQNVFNMVADLAHRAVRLNPCATPDLLKNIRGLVLVDEIDMYLHPQWQQQIIHILRDIFPHVQFVISTHSPQVLSTLRKEQIRCIYQTSDNQYVAEEPSVNPYAQSAGTALAGVLDTHPVPKLQETKDIERIETLYTTGQTEQADLLRNHLAQHGVDIHEDDVHFWKFLAARKAH